MTLRGMILWVPRLSVRVKELSARDKLAPTVLNIVNVQLVAISGLVVVAVNALLSTVVLISLMKMEIKSRGCQWESAAIK